MIDENTIVMKAVQELSNLKHFPRSIMITQIEIQLDRMALKVTDLEKKRLLKKTMRTLERLGFCGRDKQIVPIIRVH